MACRRFWCTWKCVRRPGFNEQWMEVMQLGRGIARFLRALRPKSKGRAVMRDRRTSLKELEKWYSSSGFSFDGVSPYPHSQKSHMPSNHCLPGFVHSCSAHTSPLHQQCAQTLGPFLHWMQLVKFPFFFLPPKPPQWGPPEERKFHPSQNQIYPCPLHNNTMKAQMIFPHLVALRSFSSMQE